MYAIRSALSETLRHADEFNEKTYHLITDSEYARKILIGETTPKVNLEIIKDIQKVIQIYKKCGFKLTIEHIAAHTGETDIDSKINDICDKMAKKCAKEKKEIPLKIVEIK